MQQNEIINYEVGDTVIFEQDNRTLAGDVLVHHESFILTDSPNTIVQIGNKYIAVNPSNITEVIKPKRTVNVNIGGKINAGNLNIGGTQVFSGSKTFGDE